MILGAGKSVRITDINVAASNITRSDESYVMALRCHLEGAGGGNLQANMKIRGKVIPVQNYYRP
jgi:hypothetical protein